MRNLEFDLAGLIGLQGGDGFTIGLQLVTHAGLQMLHQMHRGSFILR